MPIPNINMANNRRSWNYCNHLIRTILQPNPNDQIIARMVTKSPQFTATIKVSSIASNLNDDVANGGLTFTAKYTAYSGVCIRR